MVTDHGPIVGVNANSSNQHYEPTEESPRRFAPALGAARYVGKLDQPEAVYYDITWTVSAATSRRKRCARFLPW